jgi:hypothetical protein
MLAPIVVDPPRRYASRFEGKLLSGEKIATRVVPRSKQKNFPSPTPNPVTSICLAIGTRAT